jgi:tetratricopeptide (TPR) repeat protein
VTRTLFVDESGDFGASPRWIVSGVLCTGKPAAAEKRLAGALEAVRRQFRVRSLADLHLTELRKARGHQAAIEIARAVLKAAEGTGIVSGMLIVENARGEGLGESERTYRLMLLDLLALAHALQPEDGGDAALQLIVARRQCDGTPMSTREDLLADVIERIEDAVEAGLAARGLLGRMDTRHVRIWKAADSAGLVIADFIANLAYNRDRHESGALFDELVRSHRLRLFEGLGGYAERRARIAERDGDLAVALSRWALIEDGPESNQRRQAALSGLWQRVLGRGTMGPRATMEAVTERLWRQHKAPSAYPVLARALDHLESALLAINGPPELLYRLRNLMHLVANQMGDLNTAQRLNEAQAAIVDPVAANPSQLHLVLDAQVQRVSTDELRLDCEAVLHHARAHYALVEQYGALWELFDGAPDRAGFSRSRLWLKAQMTLLRGLLLAGGDENLREGETLLAILPDELPQDSDRARVDCYRVWLQIRKGCHDHALRHAQEMLDRRPDLFSVQFAARAAADAALADPEAYRGAAKKLLSLVRTGSTAWSGHPGDLIWRDIGVLEHACGHRRGIVAECFERSLAISDTLAKCPAHEWIRFTTEIHATHLIGWSHPRRQLPRNAELLREKALQLYDQMDLLQAYRTVSPY